MVKNVLLSSNYRLLLQNTKKGKDMKSYEFFWIYKVKKIRAGTYKETKCKINKK